MNKRYLERADQTVALRDYNVSCDYAGEWVVAALPGVPEVNITAGNKPAAYRALVEYVMLHRRRAVQTVITELLSMEGLAS